MKFRIIYLFVICFFSCSLVWAQEVFKNKELSISKIESGVWVVETVDMGAMYIIEGKTRAMLIDTGTQCEGLNEIVRNITGKPLYVVLTHNHGDHAGNVHYFDEIYMHPLDTVIPLQIPYNGKIHMLKDGDVFDLGGRKIEVLWLPGHTPGSVVFLDKTVQAAYAGDTFGSGEAWLQMFPHLPMKTYYESCVRMEKIMQEQNIKKLYLGHYPYLKRAMGIDYLLDMKQLAYQLSNGNESGSQPFKGSQSLFVNESNAFVKQGDATIVYDTDLLKQDITGTFGIEKFVFTKTGNPDYFSLIENSIPVPVLFDANDYPGVVRAAADLKDDFRKVSGNTPAERIGKQVIIIGTAGKSAIIDRLIKNGKIAAQELAGKNEKYLITTVSNPVEGVEKALVIAGSDRRGTIYGIYELSSQIGVSPWYYWADVPVVKQENLFVNPGCYTDGEPAVRYRGIFLNDEAPALSGWANATFGGFNHQFYEKVFELILRLKGNFLWPAMWGNAFYDDDPLNGALANEYGIIIGTSHHEPMGRAHDEWQRYGTGAWNYNENPEVLRNFWLNGMERMKDFETIVTVGMRGDGDQPMSEESDIALLQKIVKDQRSIISKVTKKKTEETPQVWALYKEVQDYFDKGMRVPDDITLLLCDDNWGNVRKLPDLNAPKRKGGYGMYYHFDYVGGPRNSKWINISPVSRVWEQMNLTFQYGVDRIWVVNVGDLKPMEYPISFFLDMAWNPNLFNPDNLQLHTEQWCARQFGEQYAKESARMINLYSKYNRRVTPELLDEKTYSLENYNEFERVTNDYRNLALEALRLYNRMDPDYRDAFDQLVLFPINACSNLYEMYYAVAKNRYYAEKKDIRANAWADKVRACFEQDSLLTIHYNQQIAGGKWPHMMDQTRIGYTYWQQPPYNVMPEIEYVTVSTDSPLFVEKDGYISIEAEHYSRLQNGRDITWKVIPDLGKTMSGMTTLPATATPAPDDPVYLEYDMELAGESKSRLYVFLSPTLNFNANKGLRYAVSFDGGEEKIVNFNGHYRGELGQWQAEAIIKSFTEHELSKGKHVLRFRILDPGIVLQKIVLDTGGLKPSYLGPPESGY